MQTDCETERFPMGYFIAVQVVQGLVKGERNERVATTLKISSPMR